MRSRSGRGWSSSVLLAVVLPRFLGALIPVLMYLQSSGFRVDVGALQARALSGAIGFLLLYTRTGRRIAFAGWLFMAVVIVLNLGVTERAAEAFELLLWWLAIGALWFVDWGRLGAWLHGSRSANGRFPNLGATVLTASSPGATATVSTRPAPQVRERAIMPSAPGIS